MKVDSARVFWANRSVCVNHGRADKDKVVWANRNTEIVEPHFDAGGPTRGFDGIDGFLLAGYSFNRQSSRLEFNIAEDDGWMSQVAGIRSVIRLGFAVIGCLSALGF